METGVAFAVLGACAFALGTVLQQKGTLETAAAEDDPRFLVQILARPVWLAGGAMQLAGWVLQAAALDRAPLVVVQSLMALNVVIALPIGARLTDQQITRRVWVGAVAMLLGVIVFLSAGAPQNGTASPAAAAWWSAGIFTLVGIGLLGNLGRHRHAAPRALLFGAAAGLCFALQAAVTKVFVPLVGQGAQALLTSWTTYVLIASALVGFVLQQSALKTGVLAPATASSNVVTLFGSVLFGVTVFDETLAKTDARLLPAVLALAVVAIGMTLLAHAEAPKSADPAIPVQPNATDLGGAPIGRPPGPVE